MGWDCSRGVHPQGPITGATPHNAVYASVDGSNPAICGHRKSGHFRRPETGVEFYLTAPCVGKVVWTLVRQLRGAALQHVRVMEQAIEQRRDCRERSTSGGELPPWWSVSVPWACR